MSKGKKSKRKNNNTLRKILRKIRQVTWNTSRRAVRGLVRDVMALKRHRLPQAGFVLPTVTMVMLVVILLTIAISLRSFDRADQARNVRANQQLINAATPALDRARAKLYNLIQAERGTPEEGVIYKTLILDDYTFGDETRIKVRYDGDPVNDIDEADEAGPDEDPEVFDDGQQMMEAAWKFPVDTDNDGDADSETIYGIFFKSPASDSDSARTPLEARTPPMVFEETAAGSDPFCQALNSSTGLGGGTGWENRSGNLMKSFFVYIANLPLDNDENAVGSGAISALEYQQDWTSIPPTTNAIRYEGDLEVAPGPTFNLNGKIQSLGNMIISPSGSDDINLYLISAPQSCFYNDTNNQITVGGHLVNGLIGSDTDPDTASRIKVHLMDGGTSAPTTNVTLEGAESTTASSEDVYYDEAEYEERLNELVALAQDEGVTIPDSVQEQIEDGETNFENGMLSYFSSLVRKVPGAETDCGFSCTGIDGSEDELRPADDKESTLVKPDEGVTNIDIVYLDATDPEIRENNPNKHFHIGDRVLVGHNLPSEWWDGEEFVTGEELTDEYWLDEDGNATENLRMHKTQVKSVPQVGATERDGVWETRMAKEVDDELGGEGGLRVITGAGIYSREDSFLPPPVPSTMYDDPDDLGDLVFTVVWPDTMPMSPVPGSKVYDNVNGRWIDADDTDAKEKGDLQMRASVVYHYAHDWGKKVEGQDLETQDPVYCVSSYYDPSTEETAKNENGLPWNASTDNSGKSNNGIVYDWPEDTGPYLSDLDYQAKLVYPDGRFVNELLYKALYNDLEGDKVATERTLAEQAAVDAAVCGLHILGPTTEPADSPELPDGAITEIAFLDTRQVKGVDDDDPTTDTVDESFTLTSDASLTRSENDLPLEERQPLEIRATQLDLDLLRNASITVEENNFEGNFQGPTPEYFLPNTGLVYASRDDALRDISAVLKTIGDSNFTEIEDPYDIDEIAKSSNLDTTSDNDILLDPTRRPNGIMLINGEKLARNDSNNDGQNDTEITSLDDISKEKGLVLISNDPVYIHGPFNLHEHEEFNEELTDDWSNFYSRGESEFNVNFACRPGDPRLADCTEGDSWRSAKVVADAITVMSAEWRAGFRNEGDFDLRNNAGNAARVLVGNALNFDTLTQEQQEELEEKTDAIRRARLFNGFFANDYAINGLSANWSFAATGTALEDSDYSGNSSDAINSSYFNNFQTPVQRRTTNFPEYLMEMCPKVPVSECTPGDWVVGYDVNANGDVGTSEVVAWDIDEDGVAEDDDDIELNIKAHQMRDLIDDGVIASYDIRRLLSGSTRYLGSTRTPELTAQQKNYQRYPHRVAFKRNIYGQLELENPAEMTPIPMGIRTGGATARQPDEYGYDSTTPLAGISTGTRALWFRTTENRGDPSDPDGITYENDRPLFYLDPSDLGGEDDVEAADESPYNLFADEFADGDTEIDPDNWLLPDTKFIDLNIPSDPLVDFDLGDGNNYAICVGTGATGPVDFVEKDDQEYQIEESDVTQNSTNSCMNLLDPDPISPGKIVEFKNDLLDTSLFDPDTDDTDTDTNPNTTEINAPEHFWDDGNLYIDAINSTETEEDDIWDTDTNNDSYLDGVLVYDIPDATIGAVSGDTTMTPEVKTITIAGNPDDIFVLRRNGNLTFQEMGVRVVLKGGVNPNNIFWVVDGDITFEERATDGSGNPITDSNYHQLTGNLIGSGTLNIDDSDTGTTGNTSLNTRLLGVRLLGFSSISSLPDQTSEYEITAMSSQAQPLLVPVLQIHQPTGDATAATNSMPSGSTDRAANNTKWIPRAESTEYNLIFSGGDVPSVPDENLTNGGVQNIVRLMENWQKPDQQKTKIQGAFMQSGRSKFATAPLQQTSGNAGDESRLFTYPMRYYIGTGVGKHGIFAPPNRVWGYDVGLLSQPMDRFDFELSEPVDEPDEYFREVSRDDAWLKALLCAVEEQEDGTTTPVASDVYESDLCNDYK